MDWHLFTWDKFSVSLRPCKRMCIIWKIRNYTCLNAMMFLSATSKELQKSTQCFKPSITQPTMSQERQSTKMEYCELFSSFLLLRQLILSWSLWQGMSKTTRRPSSTVESWLDERGHSLVQLSNHVLIRRWALRAANTEPCWDGRATSSGHWSRGTVRSPFPATLSLPALTLRATLSFPATALLPHRDTAVL